MKARFLEHNILKLLFIRNGLVILTIALCLSNVIMGLALIGKKERVILLPPHVKKTMTFEGEEISSSYLEEMGFYISKLLLDLTPLNYPYHQTTLLKYATPEAYGPLKARLNREGEEYTKLQLSTHFKPIEVTANPHTLNVEVKGVLSSYVSGKFVGDSQEIIRIQFTSRGAGLLFESIEGGPNHVQ
jgi:conjugal transfer pilus assembly protein TraE